jgi:hypothetical protein
MPRIQWVVLAALLLACKPEEARKQLYFSELKAPLGVGKVEIVSDSNLNLPTGGEITVITVVEPEADRDEIDRLLRSFYREVKTRGGFLKGPEKIDLRFYASTKAAQGGGDDWLAQVLRTSSTAEPTFTNKQKAPLLKWVNQVLKPSMPMFTGELKPLVLVDPVKMEVEVTWPFVSDDGSGKYVETLSYATAVQGFYATVRGLFEKIEQLTKVTFIGKHDDAVVMKIWMTRKQYVALNMTHVLETQLHAFQGQFVEQLASKTITEKQVERKTAERRRKVFRELFAKLPKEQVELIKDLR